jgi:hypothetical protein
MTLRQNFSCVGFILAIALLVTARAGAESPKVDPNVQPATALLASKMDEEIVSNLQLSADKPFNPEHPTAELKRLMPECAAWLDPTNKQVILQGEVCLTDGMLEMFACQKGTKEHESVVHVPTKAFVVHSALLAVGATTGHPVEFLPKYKSASGMTIDVMVYWNDTRGRLHRTRAQNWVRDRKTKKEMNYDWVFAGSDFYVDPESQKRFYQAEMGDFICVSNFPSAMLDVPVESSSDNDNLVFEAFTERIPKRGTPVCIVLTPRTERAAAKTGAADAEK